MNLKSLLRSLPFVLPLALLAQTPASMPDKLPEWKPFADDPSCTADDRKFMKRAFELACIGMSRGDSPIGAVLVKDGRIICEFANTIKTDSDPTMHGETGLISYAGHVLEKSLWEGATLYTSLEPCIMCTGSIYWAGIRTVVYGGTTRKPDGSAWGPERLRLHEVYKRFGWPMTVRGPLMDEEQIKIRNDQAALRAAGKI